MSSQDDYEAARLRSLEERIAELPKDPATLLKMLEQRHLLELLAWENCAEWVALRRAVTSSETTDMTALEKFGLAVLEEHRNEITDLDGGWIQDKAIGFGLLKGVDVEEACSAEWCKCAEYGDFPQECLRETDEIRAKLAAFREENK